MSRETESAFPHIIDLEYHRNGDGVAYLTLSGGLTRRDYFAAAAMTGILSDYMWSEEINRVSRGNSETAKRATAILAISMADALLAELSKGGSDE